jgi:SNF2 family DNA or RNA helicase
MIVVKSHKKLVLPEQGNQQVLNVIPHAKRFIYNGEKLIALQHGLEETKLLRNLGFKQTPAPIHHYYSWPGRFAPMKHQKETAAFMTLHNRALCLSAPGTGKTLSILWAADYMLQEKLINRVLIIAPVSTLKPVWATEIVHHLSHRMFRLVTGNRNRRIDQITSHDSDFYIINHDGFTHLPEELFAPFDLIIYDEATALKNPSTTRYKKFARFIRDKEPRLWMLTGTPIAQNPTDAWPLATLVGSQIAPKSYTQFKNWTMMRISTFKWVPRPEALTICKEVMQPSIRFSLDECIDLPDTSYLMRNCALTAHQQLAYKQMQKDAEISGTDVSAANAAVMFQKLLQICCGVAYDSEGKPVAFDDTDRSSTLLSLVDEIGGKVIVYVPLRGVQDRLEEILFKHFYGGSATANSIKALYGKNSLPKVASVHGGVTKKKRDEIFTSFQNDDKIQVLIAHPKVAAHGLTLTAASSIIWYAPIHSLEQYEQANARIKRISTVHKTVVYHIAATGFERELYYRLKEKKKVLADFLVLIAGINEKV